MHGSRSPRSQTREGTQHLSFYAAEYLPRSCVQRPTNHTPPNGNRPSSHSPSRASYQITHRIDYEPHNQLHDVQMIEIDQHSRVRPITPPRPRSRTPERQVRFIDDPCHQTHPPSRPSSVQATYSAHLHDDEPFLYKYVKASDPVRLSTTLHRQSMEVNHPSRIVSTVTVPAPTQPPASHTIQTQVHIIRPTTPTRESRESRESPPRMTFNPTPTCPCENEYTQRSSSRSPPGMHTQTTRLVREYDCNVSKQTQTQTQAQTQTQTSFSISKSPPRQHSHTQSVSYFGTGRGNESTQTEISTSVATSDPFNSTSRSHMPRYTRFVDQHQKESTVDVEIFTKYVDTVHPTNTRNASSQSANFNPYGDYDWEVRTHIDENTYTVTTTATSPRRAHKSQSTSTSTFHCDSATSTHESYAQTYPSDSKHTKSTCTSGTYNPSESQGSRNASTLTQGPLHSTSTSVSTSTLHHSQRTDSACVQTNAFNYSSSNVDKQTGTDMSMKHVGINPMRTNYMIQIIYLGFILQLLASVLGDIAVPNTLEDPLCRIPYLSVDLSGSNYPPDFSFISGEDADNPRIFFMGSLVKAIEEGIAIYGENHVEPGDFLSMNHTLLVGGLQSKSTFHDGIYTISMQPISNRYGSTVIEWFSYQQKIAVDLTITEDMVVIRVRVSSKNGVKSTTNRQKMSYQSQVKHFQFHFSSSCLLIAVDGIPVNIIDQLPQQEVSGYHLRIYPRPTFIAFEASTSPTISALPTYTMNPSYPDQNYVPRAQSKDEKDFILLRQISYTPYASGAHCKTCPNGCSYEWKHSLGCFQDNMFAVMNGQANRKRYMNSWSGKLIHFTIQNGMEIRVKEAPCLSADGCKDSTFTSGYYRSMDYVSSGRMNITLKSGIGRNVVTSFGYAREPDSAFAFSSEIALHFPSDDSHHAYLRIESLNNQNMDAENGLIREVALNLGFNHSASLNNYAIDWIDGSVRVFVNGHLHYSSPIIFGLPMLHLFAAVWVSDGSYAPKATRVPDDTKDAIGVFQDIAFTQLDTQLYTGIQKDVRCESTIVPVLRITLLCVIVLALSCAFVCQKMFARHSDRFNGRAYWAIEPERNVRADIELRTTSNRQRETDNRPIHAQEHSQGPFWLGDLIASLFDANHPRGESSTWRPSTHSSDSYLDRLPMRTYEHPRDGSVENSTCWICLEAYCAGDEVRTLPCFHLFHASCVDAWIISKGTCPVCKTSLREM
eukprot:TRINITY_DN499_c0_g4_i1.p1 TRINITY_DN499_c0_g4~~TRINITY_DN499_c0_g4_i1.p1  ORF type:complete len:1223 (-),score=151.15 TRINITY_DN499_c0_g4_i1:32-3700(-)